jgi:molybdenum cofactor biosynthesis protein A
MLRRSGSTICSGQHGLSSLLGLVAEDSGGRRRSLRGETAKSGLRWARIFLHRSFSTAAAATLPDIPSDDETDIDGLNLTYAGRSPVVVSQTGKRFRKRSVNDQTSISRLEGLRIRLREEGAGIKLERPTSAASSCATSDKTNQRVVNWKAVASRLPDPPRTIRSSAVTTDRYGRTHSYLRLSLTERCNLRCVYCMPVDGVPLQPDSHLLSTDEILTIASHFVASGSVTKFRLTGGEPTLRHDIRDVLAGLKSIQESAGLPVNIGMTTNGVTLAKNMEDYVRAGLTSVNISLDTLDSNRFAQLTRRPKQYLDRVLQALDVATQVLPSSPSSDAASTNNCAVKLNCVVMRGTNDDEVSNFVRWQLDDHGRRNHLAVRFIEYMPFTANGWEKGQLVPYQELLESQFSLQGGGTPRVEKGMQRQVMLDEIQPSDPHDTTKWYQASYLGGSDVSSVVGFITSMSNHFCAGCNRLRLGADGSFKVCLFDGTTELSLRDAVRQNCTPAELDRLIYAAVQKKHYKLGGHPDPEAIHADSSNNKPMTLIGG